MPTNNQEWEKEPSSIFFQKARCAISNTQPERSVLLIASEMTNQKPYPSGVILNDNIVYHNREFKKRYGLMINESAIQIIHNPAIRVETEERIIYGVKVILFSVF